MLLVADINIPYLKGVFEPFFDVKYLPGNAIDSDVVHDADVLVVRTRTKCNEQLLAGSTVKFIASATIGTDHIDTDYCLQNGIGWANAWVSITSPRDELTISASFLQRFKTSELTK